MPSAPPARSAPRSLYTEPAFYNALFDERAEDVAFYRALAGEGTSTVLEYGVGAGRVALPLARDGHAVVGVDTAPEMLAALAARAGREPPEVQARLAWHRGDACALSLGQRFDLVVCPFNGVAYHLDRAALGRFLGRVREHLAPGGRFAFDVSVPDPTLLAGAVAESPVFRHARTGELVRCTEECSYDPITQVLASSFTLTPAEGGEAEVLTYRQRQLFPEETLLLLEHHGFEVCWRTSRFAAPREGVADGVALEAPDARGALLAYVCRAR